MEPKNTTQIENAQLEIQVDNNALSIVELEERFELTVASADLTRCTIENVSLA
jgi:hypothetical protein